MKTRMVSMLLYFNPRSREGSDASAKTGRYAAKNFNPRSREGSDYSKCYTLIHSSGFQSTLP